MRSQSILGMAPNQRVNALVHSSWWGPTSDQRLQVPVPDLTVGRPRTHSDFRCEIVPNVPLVERVLDEERNLVRHVQPDPLGERRRLGKVGQVLDRERQRDGLCCAVNRSVPVALERAASARTCCKLILTPSSSFSPSAFLPPFFPDAAAVFFEPFEEEEDFFSFLTAALPLPLADLEGAFDASFLMTGFFSVLTFFFGLVLSSFLAVAASASASSSSESTTRALRFLPPPAETPSSSSSAFSSPEPLTSGLTSSISTCARKIPSQKRWVFLLEATRPKEMNPHPRLRPWARPPPPPPPLLPPLPAPPPRRPNPPHHQRHPSLRRPAAPSCPWVSA